MPVSAATGHSRGLVQPERADQLRYRLQLVSGQIIGNASIDFRADEGVVE